MPLYKFTSATESQYLYTKSFKATAYNGLYVVCLRSYCLKNLISGFYQHDISVN